MPSPRVLTVLLAMTVSSAIQLLDGVVASHSSYTFQIIPVPSPATPKPTSTLTLKPTATATPKPTGASAKTALHNDVQFLKKASLDAAREIARLHAPVTPPVTAKPSQRPSGAPTRVLSGVPTHAPTDKKQLLQVPPLPHISMTIPPATLRAVHRLAYGSAATAVPTITPSGLLKSGADKAQNPESSEGAASKKPLLAQPGMATRAAVGIAKKIKDQISLLKVKRLEAQNKKLRRQNALLHQVVRKELVLAAEERGASDADVNMDE